MKDAEAGTIGLDLEHGAQTPQPARRRNTVERPVRTLRQGRGESSRPAKSVQRGKDLR